MKIPKIIHIIAPAGEQLIPEKYREWVKTWKTQVLVSFTELILSASRMESHILDKYDDSGSGKAKISRGMNNMITSYISVSGTVQFHGVFP